MTFPLSSVKDKKLLINAGFNAIFDMLFNINHDFCEQTDCQKGNVNKTKFAE